MIRSRFLGFASRSLLAAGLAVVTSSAGLHAIANDQVPPKPYPDSQVPKFANPGIFVPAVLPDLTVRIKKVTCFDGHVSVKLRLQNLQNGNIGITIPFETQVKVGGLTAVIPSGASVQNPWYNGQEKGANLFPGYGTFQVAAVIDFTSGTGLVPEANEGNNVAPSPMNAFDTNPSPLFVTCDKPGDQGNAEGESPEKKPVRKKKKGEARRKAASSEGGPRLLRDPRGLPPTPVRARPTPR